MVYTSLFLNIHQKLESGNPLQSATKEKEKKKKKKKKKKQKLKKKKKKKKRKKGKEVVRVLGWPVRLNIWKSEQLVLLELTASFLYFCVYSFLL